MFWGGIMSFTVIRRHGDTLACTKPAAIHAGTKNQPSLVRFRMHSFHPRRMKPFPVP